MKANQFSCHFEKLDTSGLEGLRVAIIGGGIAGLAAAWELRRQLGPNARILLTEAYDRLGGKLKTVNYANGPVDMGAEAYMGFRQDFTELVESVGLGDQLCVPSGLPSGFYVDGALVDIPRRTLMGIPSRGADVAEVVGQDGAARIDAERNGQPMTWTPGQDTSVGQLVEARLGRIVVDRLVSPLLGGVYSCNAFDLGVRATLPQLAEELDRRGAEGQPFFLVDAVEHLLSQRPAPQEGDKPKPVFRSLRGGYASLVDALVRHANPELLRNTAVESIGRTRGGYYIDPIGEFDAVIVATPAPTASAILQYMAPTAADVLGEVDLASLSLIHI